MNTNNSTQTVDLNDIMVNRAIVHDQHRAMRRVLVQFGQLLQNAYKSQCKPIEDLKARTATKSL